MLYGTPARTEVLWESFGTDVAPSAGDLVSDVSFKDGHICFSASSLKGNAVIAVENRDEDILWSWHIWLTDTPKDQVYNNGAGTMMDRNLGATSATPGDLEAIGLLYQWGRKDPFPGRRNYVDYACSGVSKALPDAVELSTILSSNKAAAYAQTHPTTFITTTQANLDWYCSDTANKNDALWKSTKTVNDPCPLGYRVPDGGPNGLYSAAAGSSSSLSGVPYDESTYSMDMSNCFGSGIWYPASGIMTENNSQYGDAGHGHYWTATASRDQAYRIFLNKSGALTVSGTVYRGRGNSVRCVMESTSGIPPVTSITLYKTSASVVEKATLQLTATIAPSNANVKTVTWSTSNSAVATISSAGLVTAKGAGTCTITATSYNGLKATCTITVLDSFWSYILTNYDTNKDGTMSSSEISAVTGLTLSSATCNTFSNYNGIEKLTALKTLNIGGNTVATTLDVTKNTKLTYIYAGGCTKIATIKVASFSSMPCILVDRNTTFVSGSTNKSLSCTSKFIVMANGSSPLALNLTATKGKYTTSGIPTKAQATVLCDKYDSYKNLLNAAGVSSIANLTCWTSTVYRKTSDGESISSIYAYTFQLSTGMVSNAKRYQAGISSGGLGSYVEKDILKVKAL